MRSNWIGLVLGVLSAMLAYALATSALAAPAATIDSGQLSGAMEDGVAVFRGIPFAAPPVGPLRWRPPQPPAPWQGVRQAVAYGPDCVQVPMTEVPGPGFTGPSGEDCLYLNVWTPLRKPAKPLPVMVWIYGGAYIMGAGSYPDYDGAHFAQQGVVVVTINYRVGLFGFFAHPALTREAAGGPVGDYGFMDQVAALKWVHRDIAAFGGDPANVTIFGQSAGGEAVNALLVSPAARGLFAKAITQSGGDRQLPGLGWPTLAVAEARGQAWAASVGVAGDDPAALRALPADVVARGAFGPHSPAPIIDGQVVPERIEKALADGHHAVVPFMVGANSDEQSLLRWLPNATAAFLKTLGNERAAVLALYEQGGVGETAAAAEAWGEAVMVGPARFVARGMAASGAPTWLYHFAYVPIAKRGAVPGAPHGAEINYIFANEGRVSMFGEGPADAATADLMHAYWIAFAKTGDPNGPGRPPWPRYTAASDTLLEFGDDGAHVVKDFHKARLDVLDQAAAAP
jgi:para-nitrobenzyl esterase